MPPDEQASDIELDALLAQGGSAGGNGGGDGVIPVMPPPIVTPVPPIITEEEALDDWAYGAMVRHKLDGVLLELELLKYAQTLAEGRLVRDPQAKCRAAIERVAGRQGIADPLLREQAERGGDVAEQRLVAHTVEELSKHQPDDADWISYPYIAAGDVVSFESPPKDGKTTFVLGMVRAVATGSKFLDERTAGGPVLYCTEERIGTFLNALKRTRADSCSELYVVLLHETAWRLAWAETVAEIGRLAAETGARLVVVDTLSKWAGMRGDDEFSAGVAMTTMTPLQHLASTGVGVAVIRHERKAGGHVGQAGRGSSAFTGEMDTIIAVRRMPGEKTKRMIAAVGRHDETPDELVVDFSGSDYQRLGDPADLRRLEDEREVIDSMNYGEQGGLTVPDLRGELSRRTTERILRRLINEGVVKRGMRPTASGQNAWHFWLRDDD